MANYPKERINEALKEIRKDWKLEDLAKMLESDDAESVKLGIGIISNCNYFLGDFLNNCFNVKKERVVTLPNNRGSYTLTNWNLNYKFRNVTKHNIPRTIIDNMKLNYKSDVQL